MYMKLALILGPVLNVEYYRLHMPGLKPSAPEFHQQVLPRWLLPFYLKNVLSPECGGDISIPTRIEFFIDFSKPWCEILSFIVQRPFFRLVVPFRLQRPKLVRPMNPLSTRSVEAGWT